MLLLVWSSLSEDPRISSLCEKKNGTGLGYVIQLLASQDEVSFLFCFVLFFFCSPPPPPPPPYSFPLFFKPFILFFSVAQRPSC